MKTSWQNYSYFMINIKNSNNNNTQNKLLKMERWLCFCDILAMKGKKEVDFVGEMSPYQLLKSEWVASKCLS